MSYDFQQNLIGKYVWLIETIHRAGRISFKEINKRWLDTAKMSGGVDLPLRPICDIASSHLARRCFVGNLYKKVKDPNLIGKLSGHKEGSRAFSRYRNIDEETSRELVTLLE